MKFAALGLAVLILSSAACAQKSTTPAAIPAKKDTIIPREQWGTTIKPLSAEYNIAICDGTSTTPIMGYHTKLNLDDESKSALVLTYDWDDNDGSVVQSLHPVVFDLQEVSTSQITKDDGTKGTLAAMQFEWVPDPANSDAYIITLFATDSNSRAVGFFTEVNRGTKNGRSEDKPVANGLLFAQRGDVDKLFMFKDGVTNVCADSKDLTFKDTAHLMSVWVNGKYKPKPDKKAPTHHVGGTLSQGD